MQPSDRQSKLTQQQGQPNTELDGLSSPSIKVAERPTDFWRKVQHRPARQLDDAIHAV